jgi:hypothetical protein
MFRKKQESVLVIRWRGGRHPTLDLMKQTLESHGMRTFKWAHHANYRFGVRSHGFNKSLYCIEGSIEVFVPDTRERFILRPGDRIDIAKGVRHSIAVGLNGATCLEGTEVPRPLVAAMVRR